nr:RNA-directed DNA polymerase, eukaryota [Tanacetum cinerariifolium]
PDGFTFVFYRRFWNLIVCDVVKAVKWFFLHERIPSGGNSSFITLIPKVSNANMWNQSNIDTIVRVLKVFHSASGLRINMKKSKLIGIAVDASRVEQAIRQIGCMALKMPFKYLGLVVRDRMSRVKSWNDVIDTLVATKLSHVDLEWSFRRKSRGGAE